MKKIACLLCTGLVFVVLLLTGLPAFGFHADEKQENRTYTVNQERIDQKAAEEAELAKQPSPLSLFIEKNLSEQPFAHRIYFLLYLVMPFAILAISLWTELSRGWEKMQQLLLLGAAEFLFAIGNAGVGPSAIPWFCDHVIVGWIVTIVCFCYLLRILIKQGLLFLRFVSSCSDSNRKKKLLVGVLYCGIAATVTMLFTGKSYFWLAPLFIGGLWYYFYRVDGMPAAQASRMVLHTGVIFGGFLIFFFQVIGMILLVALIFFLLQGFASINSAPSAPAQGGSPNSVGGVKERAADGTPFVHNPDGSTTQLRNRGNGDFEGPDGTPWKDNGSGNLFQ